MLRRRMASGDIVHTQSLSSRLSAPDPLVREILPRLLRDAAYGRKVRRIPMIKQYLRRFTDCWSRYTGDNMWQELFIVNRYLNVHLLSYSRHGDNSDDTPTAFYHAEMPEVMLEIVRLSFDPDYFVSSSKRHCLAYLAIEILACFLHKSSQTFCLLPEKLFGDPRIGMDSLVDVLLGKLSWVDTLAVVRFFGTASFSPAAVKWLLDHPDTLQLLCKYMYRSMEVVEEKISRGEINKRDDDLVILVKSFRAGEDLNLCCRLMGLLTVNYATFILRNVLRHSQLNYEHFITISTAIKRANLLGHASYIIQQLMIWIEPGQFINYFLCGVRHCMDMQGGPEALFIEDLTYCRENKIPPGIEGLQFWSHASLWPSRLSWFMCHALCLSDSQGSGWCTFILCYVIDHAEEEICAKILDVIGPELMDLAHLVKIESPVAINVQPAILEALLRRIDVPHQLYDVKDSVEGTLKPPSEVPDFCLEAALYCKRAHLEEKMSVEEKQKRVIEADEQKDLGNQAFKAGHYSEAMHFYNKAIALCPLSARTKHAVYYSNRAECYLRNDKPMKAVHDCNRSLCLDVTAKVKVQWRRSRAYKKLKLSYPAWLDMKCIEKEWNLTKEQSGVDFRKLFASLKDEVGVIKEGVYTELERLIWTNY